LSQQGGEGDNKVTTTDSDSINENNDVFTNYDALREDGQGFFLYEAYIFFETPYSSLVPVVVLTWWCD
jgi:hypothetical protein